MCFVVALGVGGCASVRAVNTASPTAIREGLHIGDRITVITRDNLQRELTVSALSDIGIDAELPDGSLITIPYGDVQQLEARVPKPGRTAATAAGIYFGVMAIAFGIFDDAP
jgi:hypothetical protein